MVTIYDVVLLPSQPRVHQYSMKRNDKSAITTASVSTVTIETFLYPFEAPSKA